MDPCDQGPHNYLMNMLQVGGEGEVRMRQGRRPCSLSCGWTGLAV